MQVSWECSSDPDVATLELHHKHCPHVACELMLLVNRTDNDCWMDSNLACEGNDIDFVINRNWSVSHNHHNHHHHHHHNHRHHQHHHYHHHHQYGQFLTSCIEFNCFLFNLTFVDSEGIGRG